MRLREYEMGGCNTDFGRIFRVLGVLLSCVTNS